MTAQSTFDDFDTDDDLATDGGRDLPGDYDPDAETVGAGWKGAYLFTTWGYGQTNVDMAKIVDISESGKTVVARRVQPEVVGHGRTDRQLEPTANLYGDEFRLHVRGHDDVPWFRGSYPYLKGGEKADGTRRDSFMWWGSNPRREHVSETASQCGH